VAVDRVQSAEDALQSALQIGAPEPAVLIGGAPAAIGRLRLERGLVDKLLQSILKEDPECAVAVGHCVDSLLLAWLQHVSYSSQDEEGAPQFEDLRAAAQPHTAPQLVRTCRLAYLRTAPHLHPPTI